MIQIEHKIQLLDCTLRDGGYVNDWNFSQTSIGRIIDKLIESKIDIIECGYLSQSKGRKENCSIYPTTQYINSILESKKSSQTKFACMINFGEYNIEDIPLKCTNNIDIIRLAFHKKDIENATNYAEKLQNKGYWVFMQPMVISGYDDVDIQKLLVYINSLHPKAVYIVDSFGSLKNENIKHLTKLFDDSLIEDISIGFHAHNNLQLAYSNALLFIDAITSSRDCIIDSSVFGMGRGAGNLCTELIVRSLIENKYGEYTVQPLLEIMDEYLMPIYLSHPWGYQAAYFLSATANCHPNYATHLLSKQTLQIRSIDKLLLKIPTQERLAFNQMLIETLYRNYQETNIDDALALADLKQKLLNKTVLLLAPGISLSTESEHIRSYICKEKPTVISVNFVPENYDIDYVFISNQKRFGLIEELPKENIIITSNIREHPANAAVVDYTTLLNNKLHVSDNSGLMLITLLRNVNVKKIVLAGFDGYSENPRKNYFETNMIFSDYNQNINTMRNIEMCDMLSKLGNDISITFLTKSKYNE